MEKRNWTTAQSNAMDTRDRTLLVSAAAGSGKTAVLTERIIRSLTDPEHPGDISRMLIVTFTRAAANQLRQKISAALSNRLAMTTDDPALSRHLSHQLMMLGGARISTIDSFYLDIVKANFQAANLPPTFRMADKTELAPLRQEIMNDVIERMYAEVPDFTLVSDSFSELRNGEALCTALIEIADKLSGYPESLDILLRTANELETHADDVLNTRFGHIFLATLREFAATGVQLFSQALAEMESEVNFAKLDAKWGVTYRDILQRCRTLTELCAENAANANGKERYDAIRNLLILPLEGTDNNTKPKASTDFAAKQTLCKQFLTKWSENAPVWGANSNEEVRESALETARTFRALHTALHHYEQELFAAKRSREIAEFSDIARAAYLLLVEKDGSPTPLARELSDTFDAIYIDEYQDVNAMQDATFRAISKPRNRFLVGDIKQSIYRFRGAQPTVFAGYRKRFPLFDSEKPMGDEAMIFMSNCFRCDKNVIRFSNAVSGFLFSRSAESIGYTQEDDLVFSKEESKSGNAKCRVLLLEPLSKKERGTSTDGAGLEARMIAAEIKKLLDSGRKADGTPIVAGDIAILSRKTTHFDEIAAELEALGIPCNDTSETSFFENPEVLCMYSLLATVDNPFRDIYLAATLRSPFFGFTLEELVSIHTAGDRSLSLYEALCQVAENGTEDAELQAKAVDFLTRLGGYREKAQILPVDKLLRYLYRETAVLAFAGYESNDRGHRTRKENLNRLYEYARTFESNGFKGLYQFIRYVDAVMENGAQLKKPEGAQNAVQMMTIHGSKGLEFPICFLVNAGSAFSTKDYSQPFLCDEHIGCAMYLPNAGPFSRYDTFFRRAIEMDLRRQNREEEMRLLYVAMTRAVEQLIVTTALPGKFTSLQRDSLLRATPNIGTLAFGSNYVHWIMAALEAAPDHEEFVTVSVIQEESLAITPDAEASMDDAPEAATPPQWEKVAPEQPAGTREWEILCERFSYVYPYAHLTRLPAKMSVSRLSPVALDVFDSDDNTTPLALPEETERLLHTFERTPLFGTKPPDAAARGTATHEFLQFCDFERVEKQGVATEIGRLIEERYLSPAAQEAVRIDELERFFESEFYRSLRSAVALHRETRFHITLPAADFTEDDAFAAQLQGETLLVQGVIDLFYTNANGELILCDYKTDRLTKEELRDPAAAAQMLSARHGRQLSYYAMALEEICGKRPDRILIYSLPLGGTVDVTLTP